MPWKVFKNGPDDKPYCVYKHDGEGNPVGKSRGCHPTEEEAERQIAAIHANTAKAVETTENYVRVRVRDPDDFVRMRTITLSESEGIKAIIGPLKSDPGGSTHIQTYLFDKDKWDTARAKAWVSEHKESKKTIVVDPNDLSTHMVEETIVQAHEKVGTRAVKAVMGDAGEWFLDVLIPFGGPYAGKDSQGEWFDEYTDFCLDQYQTPPAPPVAYYHGHDPQGRPIGRASLIGKSLSRRKSGEGWWFHTELDRAKPLAGRVWEAAKQGRAAASPGGIAHMKRRDPNGYLPYWPLVEISVFDVGEGRSPANPYAVVVPAAKAMYEQAGIDWPDNLETEPETEAEEAEAYSADVVVAGEEETILTEVEEKMDEKQVADLIAAAFDEREAKKAAEEEAKKAEEERIEAEVQRRLDEKAEEEAEAAKAQKAVEDNRLFFGPDDAPQPLEFGELRQFDNHTVGDLAFALGVQEMAYRKGLSPDTLDRVGKTHKSQLALKAIAVRMAEDKEPDPMGFDYQGALKAAGMATKANELMRSTYTSYGKEWVGTAYSRELWEAIRFGTPVLRKMETRMREIPQGMSTLVLPTEGSDPTWYKVAEAVTATSGRPNVTVTASKHTTSNVTLSVAKVGARVMWTGELDEDSLIRYAPDLRRRMEVSGAELLEALLIDGDTAGTAATNINDIAGTPATTDWFLAFNGFRKFALVTNTANSRDGGAITEDDFVETLRLLGTGGREGMDPSKVSFILDPVTNWQCIKEITAIKTKDVFSQPTLEGNKLSQIWGYEVLLSPHMMRSSFANSGYEYKSEATGKIDIDTAADNTKGQIIAVRWDKLYMAYKRRMTIEVDRWPESDANQIVAMCRVGLTPRNSTTPDCVAISYNLTV